MISQNLAHIMLQDLKENLKCSPENYDKEESEFINEFNFIWVEEYWFSFGQLDKIETLWLNHGFFLEGEISINDLRHI